MDEHAKALTEAVEAALPGWIERSVRRRLADAGLPADAEVLEVTAEAARLATREVGEAMRRLLGRDVDEQATTPLSLLRGAVRYPTAVLAAAGVAPVARDRMQADLFPEDVYDLAPATFADVDPALAEPGLVWGAAKAHAHMHRHAAPERPERRKVAEP